MLQMPFIAFKRRSAFRFIALGALLTIAAPLRAQAPPTDTIRAARALRDSSRFAEAATLLRGYVITHPANGDAARLLTETLYWAKDIAGARAVAESSMVRFPEDYSLRLQYGAMLVDLGDRSRATEVLTPLLGSPQRARAAAPLGKLAYWDGDLSAAQRFLVESLHATPSQPDVRRQLGEILEASAPSVGAGTSFTHDDQPIDVFSFDANAQWFATPLARFTARVEPMFFRLSDTATRTLTRGEIAVADYLPAAHVDVELGAGGLQRSFGSSTDWVGRGSLGVRLPAHVALRGSVERAPYLYTEASLSTPVMTTTATAAAKLSTPNGWLGEAAFQEQRYPDANSVTTVYAWLLAPLVHNASGDVQVGYSGARQDATESRYVLAHSAQSFPPGSPRVDLSGRYVPYYTPNNLMSHSAIVAITGHASQAVTLRMSGAYAFHATDNATTFVTANSPPPQSGSVVAVIAPRTFTPWNAHASIDVAGESGLTVAVGGDVSRTAFYTAAGVELRLTYRLGLMRRRQAVGY